MEESRRPNLLKRLRKPAVAIPLLLGISFLCAPFVVRGYRLAGLPDIGDPFDVDAFKAVHVSDQENAFVEYREALDEMTPLQDVDYDSLDAVEQDGWDAATPEIREWVAENKSAFEAWQRGTRKSDSLSISPADSDLSSDLSLSNINLLTRLVQLNAIRLQSEGKVDEAWETYLALFRFSRHLGRHGSTMERLRGCGVHAIVSQAINRAAASRAVNEKTLRAALARLRDDFSRSEPIGSALKMEYIYSQNLLSQTRIQESRTPQAFLFYFLGEPALTRRILQHHFAGELSHHSYRGEHGPIPEHLSADELEPFIESSRIAPTLVFDSKSLANAITRESVRQATLELSLQAQIYARQHGAFPQDGRGLILAKTKLLPSDPYDTLGHTLRYGIDPKTGNAIVWSVGEDGRDNRGDVEFGGAEPPADIGFVIGVPK